MALDDPSPKLPKTWPVWVGGWLYYCREMLAWDEVSSPLDLLGTDWIEGYQFSCRDMGENCGKTPGKFRWYTRRLIALGYL